MTPSQEAKRGLGASAVFFARNRFAVLDKATNTIQVHSSRVCRYHEGPATSVTAGMEI